MTTCEYHEIMLENGECSACDPYTAPSEDKLNCMDPVCAPRYKITPDGACA